MFSSDGITITGNAPSQAVCQLFLEGGNIVIREKLNINCIIIHTLDVSFPETIITSLIFFQRDLFATCLRN